MVPIGVVRSTAELALLSTGSVGLFCRAALSSSASIRGRAGGERVLGEPITAGTPLSSPPAPGRRIGSDSCRGARAASFDCRVQTVLLHLVVRPRHHLRIDEIGQLNPGFRLAQSLVLAVYRIGPRHDARAKLVRNL